MLMTYNVYGVETIFKTEIELGVHDKIQHV